MTLESHTQGFHLNSGAYYLLIEQTVFKKFFCLVYSSSDFNEEYQKFEGEFRWFSAADVMNGGCHERPAAVLTNTIIFCERNGNIQENISGRMEGGIGGDLFLHSSR